MSEVLGRRIPLFFGFALFGIFQIPVALAQNIATVCVGRFLGGFFAAAPLATTGGALADLWDPIPRSYAICIFAAGGFAGPVAGPIAGGFITESHLGWRWTSWITLIMAGLFGVIGWFVVPETSAARILQLRAARLRKETGNTQYHAAADANKLTVDRVINVYLLRPFVMFAQEPILALVTAYMSFLYGIVYLLFEAVSYPFTSLRLAVSLHNCAVPSFVLRRARLVSWRLATTFCRLHRRNPHGRRHNRIQLRNELYTRIPQARQSRSRRASTPHDRRSHRPTRRSLLVRLDQQSTYHMGPTGAFGRFAWIRLHGPVLARHELPHRLLWLLLQQCHRSQHLYQIICRRLLPSLHARHVPQPRGSMGNESAGLHLCCFYTCAGTLLHLRCED